MNGSFVIQSTTALLLLLFTTTPPPITAFLIQTPCPPPFPSTQKCPNNFNRLHPNTIPPKKTQSNLYSSLPPSNLEPTTSQSLTQWNQTLTIDGITKIPSALQNPDLVDAITFHLDDQKIMAWFAGMEDSSIAKTRFFYSSQSQPHTGSDTCQLQLSLLRGGYAGDYGKNVSDTERHILADVLVDLFLGPEDKEGDNGDGDGSLLGLVEMLVGNNGELCELVALLKESEDGFSTVVPDTDDAGKIHDDSIASDPTAAPWYSILLALQDIDETMAPIAFYTGTHTSEKDDEDEGSSPCVLATMKKGDAIVYDGRIRSFYPPLPDQSSGPTSNSLLRISFRSPEWQQLQPQPNGDMGWIGALRPGYRGALALDDWKQSLRAYRDGDGDAFEKYGDGIDKPFHNVDAEDAVDVEDVEA